MAVRAAPAKSARKGHRSHLGQTCAAGASPAECGGEPIPPKMADAEVEQRGFKLKRASPSNAR